MKIRLEWDENKQKENEKKHGLSFTDAKYVFSEPTVSFLDDRFNYGETRFITLGKLAERVVVLVHTERESVIRIISMRKANAKEQEIYKEQLKKNRSTS